MVMGTHKVVEDLIADDAGHFEALLAGDRVDNHVAVDTNEVLRVENTVLILANGQLSAGLVKAVSGKRTRSAAWRR
jgi:hypothetical protein